MSDPSPDGRLLPGSWACALPGCEVCLARGHINDTEALAIYRAETRRLRDALREIVALPQTTRIGTGSGAGTHWQDAPVPIIAAQAIARKALGA